MRPRAPALVTARGPAADRSGTDHVGPAPCRSCPSHLNTHADTGQETRIPAHMHTSIHVVMIRYQDFNFDRILIRYIDTENDILIFSIYRIITNAATCFSLTDSCCLQLSANLLQLVADLWTDRRDRLFPKRSTSAFGFRPQFLATSM